MELNKLIYAGTKLLCDKIGVAPPPKKNTNWNSKPGWEIRREMQFLNVCDSTKSHT